MGQCVLLATDDYQLHCFDAAGQRMWHVAMPYGPLAGAPLAVGDRDYLAAAVGGTVWRIDGASGKDLGRVDVGEPLATGPVVLADSIVVGGADGCLHKVKKP